MARRKDTSYLNNVKQALTLTGSRVLNPQYDDEDRDEFAQQNAFDKYQNYRKELEAGHQRRISNGGTQSYETPMSQFEKAISNNKELDGMLRMYNSTPEMDLGANYAKAKVGTEIKRKYGIDQDTLDRYASLSQRYNDGITKYENSDAETRAKDFTKLQRKIDAGNTLSNDETLIYSQSKLDELSDKDRSRFDRITASKNYKADNTYMGITQKDAPKYEKVRDIEKELLNDGWTKKSIKEYEEYASRLDNYNRNAASESALKVNENDSAFEKYLKAGVGTAGEILTAPYDSIMALGSQFGYKPKGFGADTNDKFSRLKNVTEGAQTGTSDWIGQHEARTGIGQKVDEFSKKHTGQTAGQMLYNSFVAAAESAETAGIGSAAGVASGSAALGEAVGLSSFAASGYTSAYEDARERGLNQDQAVMEGIIGGTAEVLTEKVSMDHFLEMASDTRLGKNLVFNWLAQAGIEGSEELASDFINNVSDALIANNGQSKFDTLVNDAVEAGASKDEAMEAAKNQIIQESVSSAVAGVLSGGISGGIGTGVSVYKASQINKQAQNISNQYAELAANTTDADAKAKYEQYAQNPYQKMADDISYDEEAKQNVQSVADRANAGKKVTVSDRASISESLDIADRIENAKNENAGKRSVVPDSYKTKVSDITADDGYAQMKEAASKGDAATMREIQAQMEVSTDANARAMASDDFNALRSMAESKGADTNILDGKIATQQDAYLAGLRGEEFETSNDGLKQAYNDGKMKALDEKSKTMIQSKDSLKNVKAETALNENVTIERLTGDKIVASNGQTYNFDELKIEDTGAGNFIRQTQNIKGDLAKQAFLDNVEEGSTLNRYSEEFNKVYKAAQIGLELDKVTGVAMLSDEAKQNIYDAGLKDQYNEGRQKAMKAVYNAMNIKRGTGTCTDYRGGMHFDNSYLIGSAVANVTGLNVVIQKSGKGNINADFNAATSTITVYGTEQMKQVFHEVGEFMQFYNEEGHNDLRKALNEVALNVLGGENYARWHDNYMTGYAKAGDAQSNLEISNEMANDLMVALMETSKGRKAMAKYLAENMDQTKAQEFATKFGNMVASIKDAISNIVTNKDTSFQKAVLKKGADQLAEYADKFIEELDKAIEIYQSGQIKTAEESTKNSVDINGYDSTDINGDSNLSLQNECEYDGVVYHKYQVSEREYNLVKEKLGQLFPMPIERRDTIVYNGDVLYCVITDGSHQFMIHNVFESQAESKDVGEFYELYRNRTESNENTDKQGIDQRRTNGNNVYIENGEVRTENVGLLKRRKSGSNAERYNEDYEWTSKDWEWYRSLSVEVSEVDSKGKELTQGQQEFFKDSAMRDENGALKVFYHGTSNYGFNIFDLAKAKSTGLYGRGIYFGDSNTANTYGKTYEVYLNIANPLKSGTNDITRDQMLKLVNEVANDEDLGIDNYGYGATPQSIVDSLMGKDDFAMLQDINATCVGDFVSLVKLFNRINGTAYDGIEAADQVVAFYPNQIKNTDNANPTENDDIRYSVDVTQEEYDELKEQSKKSKSVSFGKSLIAVHNLTEEQLLSSIKLGGLPSPSIAIIKSAMGHSMYGKLSLMFKSDSIDPKKNKNNKIYGGDAYTPTFPTVGYLANEDVVSKASKTLYDLVGGYDKLNQFGYVALDSDEIQDHLSRNNGKVSESLYYKKGMKYAYLRSLNAEYELPYKTVQKTFESNDGHPLEALEYVANKLSDRIDEIENMGARFVHHTMFDNPAIAQEVMDAINEYYKGIGLDTDFYGDEIKIDFSNKKDIMRVARVFNEAKRVRNGLDLGEETVFDDTQFDLDIENAGGDDAVKTWIDSLYEGVVDKVGLRNNKDVFLPSGNRRSWNQLHDEYTLENIVKLMNQNDSKGADTFFGQSAIKAIATKDFSSIDELHKSESQLMMMDDSEYERINNEFSNKFNEIVSEIYDKSESNYFIAMGEAGDALADAARSNTVAGIEKILKQYPSLDIKSDTAQKLYDLMQDIAEMPTGYFEAKPRRAVWLNEIAKAIVPDSISQELVDALHESGIAYETYPDGNEEARTALLANSDDLRFSVDIEDDWDAIFAATEESTTREAASVLSSGMEALKHTEVSDRVISSLANKIKNQTGSTINYKTLKDNLSKVFAYMQNEDFVDYADMMGIIKEVARPIIDQSTTKVGVEAYNDFVNKVKGYSIKLTAAQKKEVASIFGSYGRFRSMMMPLNISDNGAVTLEQVWQELSEATGYALNYDTVEGDMPTELYDVLTAMRPTIENTFGADAEEAAQDLAMQIVEEYFTQAGKELGKTANAEKLKKASDKMREYNKQYRADIKARYDGKLSDIKAKNRKRAAELKEKRLQREYKDKLKSEAGALYKRLMDPTEKKHVPTDMLLPVLEFMNGIDFVDPIIKQNADGKWESRIVDHVENKKPVYETIVGDTRTEVLQKVNEAIYAGAGSKSQRTWTERMRDIQNLYDTVKNGGSFDDAEMMNLAQLLDADLAAELGDMLTRNNKLASVNQLSSDDLRTLRRVIGNINHAITKADKALSMPARISELAHKVWEDADAIADPRQMPKMVKLFGDLLRQDMMNPKTFMTFLGEAGDKLYQSLREGLNREIHDIKTASKFIDKTKSDLGITEKDIKEWTGPHAKVLEFKLADGTIRLTPVQIMSLYETSKRAGAQDRIIEGIKASDIVQFGKLPLQQKKAYHVNQADIKTITDTLTPQQKAFADALQKYMAEDCSKQGNEVTKALYGYEKYIDPSYFPYTVDKNSIASTEQTINQKSMTGEHAGFTNPLKKGATNVLVMDDIFKVFSRHVAEMSKYHGYTVANKDVVRWLNYKEFDDVNGKTRVTVKDSINKLSRSDAGVTYIENVLSDIAGGGAAGTKAGKIIDTIASGFKASAVMGNLRVVFQQPTAYFRALNMVSPKYLFTVNVAKAFRDVERVNELSDIAWWKAQGYFETNIGQSLESVINGQQNFRDKVNDIAGKLAGKADDVTWSLLYQAIEKEQRAMLGATDEETFRKAVNARFDEVVDSTQVVDATLLRSQYMRDKDGLAKLQTAFMAEPTKTYNMLAEAVIKDYRDIKAGNKAGGRTARAITAFTLSSIATAAAAAVMDAVRYDDDDEKWNEIWYQNFIKNFIDNENPLNLIPWVKDIWAEIEKNASGDKFNSNLSRYDLDAILGTVDAFMVEIPKIFNGESNKTGYGKIMAFVKPLSQLSGIPAYSVTRDLVAVYNLVGNQFEAGLKTTETTSTNYKNAFMNVDPFEEPERKVDEAIDSLEGGVSVNDLLNKIQSTYKEDYVAAMDGEDLVTATDIRNNVYITYNLLGLKPEDAQKALDKWLEESAGYGSLDKAINEVSAKGQFTEDDYKYLSEEMAKVIEVKETDKIMEHLVDKFGTTISFEDNHETESEYRNTLDSVVAMIDGTYDYDYVKETVDEIRAERAEKAAAKAAKAERKTVLIDAINSGEDYRSAIDEMLGAGTEAKTIKQDLTREYKDKYMEAVKNKDYSTANDIQRKVAQAKAYADKKANIKLANKWNGDYFAYEMNEIKTGWIEKDK